MQIYFHSRLWSYLPRVPILVEDTVYIAVVMFPCDNYPQSLLYIINVGDLIDVTVYQ